MNPQELMELPLAELREREETLRKELFNLRFQKKLGQAPNPMRIRTVRRELARVLTFMGKKREA